MGPPTSSGLTPGFSPGLNSDLPSGLPAHGAWSGPFSRPDTTTLVHLPRPGFSLGNFREKRWCYAGIVHPEIFFGCAVVHLGYLTSAFCFVFDRTTRQMTDHALVRPPLGTRFDRNPETGTCRFKTPGKFLEMSSRPGRNKIQARFKFSGQTLEADLEILPPPSNIASMNFFMPMEQGNHAFTAKTAGLRAQGHIRLNQRIYDLEPEKSFVVWDWTHGAYPRKTFWNWACGAGVSTDQTLVGFNFSSGVYEQGFLENVVWINGIPEPLGRIEFLYDGQHPDQPWQIKSRDNRVDLVFEPEGIRRADDNFALIQSRFIQPCGRFKGKLVTASGQHLVLETLGGVVEEHFAKW